MLAEKNQQLYHTSLGSSLLRHCFGLKGSLETTLLHFPESNINQEQNQIEMDKYQQFFIHFLRLIAFTYS